MTTPRNSHRQSLFRLPAAAFVLALTWVALGPAARAEHIDPQTFVSDLGERAIMALANKSLDDKQREDEFRKLFLGGFNVRTLGRFSVGRYWRVASKAERREYLALFSEFIVRTYAKRLSQYTGEKFRVVDSRDDTGHDTIVNSLIERPEGEAVKVDWRVRERKHKLKIVDVVVEGISMAITQRDEFSSVIRRGGGAFKNLLVELRRKNAE